ncbi:MAG: acyl-CoA dehydrogenase family protein, partial [Pseudomonadota bacterium]|nr:acyl-CoA dehydrogenase family protein [Pseudomonadota bacterium]
MDFNHTEDRRMISDSLRRYLAEQYDNEFRNKIAYEAPFHDASKWAELAELGILGALVSEADGGFGGDGFDISVVFEELGRGLCAEPMLANLMALRLYAAFGKSERVDAIIAGAERAALAVWESDAFATLEDISMTGGETLSGRKTVVYGGNSADHLLVVARTAAGKTGLYEVAAADAEVLSYAMIDGGGAAEIVLDN